jgi:hypothetical protein
MELVGSIVSEQGVTFAVVQVHSFMVETAQDAQDAIFTYGSLFPGMPVVVMAVGGASGPTYWGRSDLANYMAQVHPARIEWRRYSFAN